MKKLIKQFGTLNLRLRSCQLYATTIAAVIAFSMAGCPQPDVQGTTPTVTDVTVSPVTPNVVKGGTQTFTATVTGTNDPAQNVTWSIDETSKNAGTAISSGGVLTVAVAETLTTLTVRATSTVDTTKSGQATVTVTASGEQENVVTYPWPDGMTKYAGITMTADGKNIDLYSVRANNTYFSPNESTDSAALCNQIPVGMFDMQGVVQIEINVPSNASNVIVRPVSSNITPIVNGKKITFSITKPGQYSVEYNNTPVKPENTVLIFANQIESFSGTTVVEAGIHNQNYTVN